MNSKIVRAWKDEFYRQSLSDEERAQLPENPVGELELTEAELESVFAGHGHDEHTHDHCQNPDISFTRDGCYTQNFSHECVRPHHTFDFNDCYSYHFNFCHHYTRRYSRECYPYQDKH
jgi:mersacidin/lichenicidin family type 2 lantibiotic